MAEGIRNYIEKLGLIYFGFIAVPLVLFPVVYLPIKDGELLGYDADPATLFYVTGLMLFLVIFFARRLFKRNLAVISADWPLSDKLSAYRKASIVFYTLGLVACLVSVGLLKLTRHQLFVATYPFLLLILSLYRPTIERLKRDLLLTEKDLSVIDNQR